MSNDKPVPIDEILQKFIKRNSAKDPVPKLLPTDTGQLTVEKENKDRVKGLLDYLEENFSDPNGPINKEAFNFIQDLMKRNINEISQGWFSNSVTPTDFNSVVKKIIADNCHQYGETRPDLISELRLPILINIGLACLGSHISELNPEIFEKAPTELLQNLEELDDSVLVNLTAEQIAALMKNPSLSAELRNRISKLRKTTTATRNISVTKKTVAVVKEQIPETEELSLNIPPTTERSNTKVANTKVASAKVASTKVADVNKSPKIIDDPLGATKLTSTIRKANATTKKQVTKSANQTVITETSSKDVDDIVGQIRNHLARFKKLEEFKFYNSNKKDVVLKLGQNQISTRCMIYYLSGRHESFKIPNPKFLNICSAAISDYLLDGKIDLGKLITLSKNFDRDQTFYQNLYDFIISMANFVATDDTFSTATYDVQFKILAGLKDFITQTITYLTAFMDEHKVMDDSLLKSSYNLLLLLNTFAYRHANTGRSTDELRKIYQQLTQAIQANINLYKTIRVDDWTLTEAESNLQISA